MAFIYFVIQVSRPNPQRPKFIHHSQKTYQNLFIDDIERPIREFALD